MRKAPGPMCQKLARFFHLDHAMALQGDQGAVDRGDGLTGFPGQVRQGQAGAGGQMAEHVQPPVQRLDGVLVGLVVESLRPAARVSVPWGLPVCTDEKAQGVESGFEKYHLCHKMKNLFEKIAMRGMGA